MPHCLVYEILELASAGGLGYGMLTTNEVCDT